MKDANKLKRRKDFAYTYKKGLSRSDNNLVLVFCPTKQGSTKIGFSVTSKYGCAVERNRIKRQLREVLSTKVEKIKKGFNLVFIVKVGAVAEYAQLDVSVENLLASADLTVKL